MDVTPNKPVVKLVDRVQAIADHLNFYLLQGGRLGVWLAECAHPGVPLLPLQLRISYRPRAYKSRLVACCPRPLVLPVGMS